MAQHDVKSMAFEGEMMHGFDVSSAELKAIESESLDEAKDRSLKRCCSETMRRVVERYLPVAMRGHPGNDMHCLQQLLLTRCVDLQSAEALHGFTQKLLNARYGWASGTKAVWFSRLRHYIKAKHGTKLWTQIKDNYLFCGTKAEKAERERLSRESSERARTERQVWMCEDVIRLVRQLVEASAEDPLLGVHAIVLATGARHLEVLSVARWTYFGENIQGHVVRQVGICKKRGLKNCDPHASQSYEEFKARRALSLEQQDALAKKERQERIESKRGERLLAQCEVVKPLIGFDSFDEFMLVVARVRAYVRTKTNTNLEIFPRHQANKLLGYRLSNSWRRFKQQNPASGATRLDRSYDLRALYAATAHFLDAFRMSKPLYFRHVLAHDSEVTAAIYDKFIIE